MFPKFVVKYGLIVALVGILIAIYLKRDTDWYNLNENREIFVLRGLLDLEAHNLVLSGNNKPRVAVGYGACHDLFVNATDLLKPYNLKGTPTHFDEIKSDDELLRSFAYYFKHGAAAERFTSSSKLFNKWVLEASKIATARWALGGNAPVMASRFHKEGCDVLLAAKMTDKLRQNLNKAITVTSEIEAISDDIHLILEYTTHEIWNKIQTPRANRYILHNDQNNPTVSSLEDFGKFLPNFKPDLVIISGLQMMDNYPFQDDLRMQRLIAIKDQMIEQGKFSRIHFEMASFVEELLLEHLMQYVIPYSDSLGMNEQELTNLHNLYLFGTVTHVADFNPRVATVLDQMRMLYKTIRNKSTDVPNSKPLTRIHVHTLAYQAILTEHESKWRRSKAAAAKASLTANRHVCASNVVNVTKSKLILDHSFALSAAPGSERMYVNDRYPVTCWNETIPLVGGVDSNVEICIAPVLVCTEAKQTAGCGDNISSAGLVLQI